MLIGGNYRLEPVDANAVIRQHGHVLLGPLANGGEQIDREATLREVFQHAWQRQLRHIQEEIMSFVNRGWERYPAAMPPMTA